MLNEAQMQWVNEGIKELELYINQHWPMTDQDWDYVVHYIEQDTNTAKQEAPYVRRMYFNFVEYWDKKDREERCLKTF